MVDKLVRLARGNRLTLVEVNEKWLLLKSEGNEIAEIFRDLSMMREGAEEGTWRLLQKRGVK